MTLTYTVEAVVSAHPRGGEKDFHNWSWPLTRMFCSALFCFVGIILRKGYQVTLQILVLHIHGICPMLVSDNLIQHSSLFFFVEL